MPDLFEKKRTLFRNMGGSRGGTGVRITPLENHKLLYVSFELLVQTPSSSDLTPTIASRRRSVRPSVKTLMTKKFSETTLTEFSGSAHAQIVGGTMFQKHYLSCDM